MRRDWWNWCIRDRAYRGVRGLILLLVMAFASGGFVVLTAQAESSRLDVRGAVGENARAAYDILVRPPGARLPQEERAGLIQPGFLGAADGGITVPEWRTIQGIAGVEVAAPVAIVGYVTPIVSFDVQSGLVDGLAGPVVLRRTTTWTYDNGASRIESTPSVEYVTPRPLDLKLGGPDGDPPASWVERRPGPDSVFPIAPAARELVDDGPVTLGVRSTATREARERYSTVDVHMPFPFLLAAVDPAAEAELSGLDGAVVDGDYLTPGVPAGRDFGTPEAPEPRQPVPVLVASEPLTRLRAEYRIERLPAAAANRAAAGASPASLASLPGTTVGSGVVTEQQAYRKFLDAMSDDRRRGDYYAFSIRRVIRTDPVDMSGGSTVSPAEAENGRTAWGTLSTPIDVAESIVAPGGDDTAFRESTGLLAEMSSTAPALLRTGVFDAGLLRGNESLGRVPLGTYAFDPVVGADERSRTALRDDPWFPSGNLSGYLQPPPMMLTTLDAMSAFTNPWAWYTIQESGPELPGTAPVPEAPISAVRVRVADVTGVDEVSRERLRSVAEQIATRTGLDVDITVGSSPSPQRVDVAAGRYGRPRVTLEESWVKKGVAVTLIRAADRKSVLLSAIILLVCALVVANAAFTSIRSRRREIGTLRCLGWSARAVFTSVLGSLLVVAVRAGLLGCVAVALYARIFDEPIGWSRLWWAIPASIVIALVAGIAPAWWAARLEPTDAVRPLTGSARRVARRARGIATIGARAAATSPGRSLVVILALAIATAALALLWMVVDEFRRRAVGSLLGEAVTVQVRDGDLAAVGVLLGLSGIAVAHLVVTEIRERAAEFAVLRAMGWRRRRLATLVLVQAGVLGALGAIAGVGVAWLAYRQFLMQDDLAGLRVGSQAGAVGFAIALGFALLPAALITRLAPARSLSEE
ncbi:MAG: ABC transporter permease [Nocardioides sp.]